jgi:hypothetical protein
MEFSIQKVGKGNITPTELLHLVNHMEHTNQLSTSIAGSVELFEFNTIFNNLINVYAQLFTHKLYIDKVLCVLFSGRVYASIKSTTSSLILYIIYTCVIYLVD